jgi:hypothetical protein
MSKPSFENTVTCFVNTENNRTADVILTKKGYVVVCFEGTEMVKTIDVSEHSMNYAEDTAENWVEKWGAYA